METDIGSWTPYYEGLVHGTPRILEVLRANTTPATFYFTGDSLVKHPSGHESRAPGMRLARTRCFHETIGDPFTKSPACCPCFRRKFPTGCACVPT